MNKEKTRKRQLVRLMLKKGEITASQVEGISNPNQYFVDLENDDIVKSRWIYDEKGNKKCKARSIKNYAKAKSFVRG